MFPRAWSPPSFWTPSWWEKPGGGAAKTGKGKGVGGRQMLVQQLIRQMEEERSVLDGRREQMMARRMLLMEWQQSELKRIQTMQENWMRSVDAVLMSEV